MQPQIYFHNKHCIDSETEIKEQKYLPSLYFLKFLRSMAATECQVMVTIKVSSEYLATKREEKKCHTQLQVSQQSGKISQSIAATGFL
jgi:hypothetical protein